jgi:hypothetical protein
MVTTAIVANLKTFKHYITDEKTLFVKHTVCNYRLFPQGISTLAEVAVS